MAELLVPISPGELIDKITILEIKSQRITDAATRERAYRAGDADGDVVGIGLVRDRHRRRMDRPA
jgi:hypothetical protein